MDQRVDAEDVKAIIETKVGDLTPFIAAAHLLVERHVTPHLSDEALLKEIERWLAAHFLAVRDPRLTQQRIGDASENYEGAVGVLAQGLEATRYGRQAVAIDPTGGLAAAHKQRATLKAL